jgi:ribonuclease HII
LSRRSKETTVLAVPRLGIVLPSQQEERRLHGEGYPTVAGIDEVGRGPIAGPVVAAAVVLPDLVGFEHEDLTLIRDSKQLTAVQRERANILVREIALGFGIGEASPEEIDLLGIAPATRKAMRRALDKLADRPSHLLIDAFPLDWHKTPCTPIIKGDSLCTAIAAASVIAKVYRDAIMVRLNAMYPGYGLGGHKGYASVNHLAAVAQLGPSPVHRRSFSPFKPTLFDL